MKELGRLAFPASMRPPDLCSHRLHSAARWARTLEAFSDGVIAIIITKGILSVALYAIAIPLAFVLEWIADALYVAIALMWLIPDRPDRVAAESNQKLKLARPDAACQANARHAASQTSPAACTRRRAVDSDVLPQRRNSARSGSTCRPWNPTA